MKATFAILAGAALVAAQDLSSLPQCGQTCITNMIDIASSNLGCSNSNVTCYCTQPDFGYGVRDCSLEACPNRGTADTVIAYGLTYCSSALEVYSSTASLSVAGSATPILASATIPAMATGTASLSTATVVASSSAITTSALTALVSASGSSYTTTTGMTTIYAGGAANATGVVVPVGQSRAISTSTLPNGQETTIYAAVVGTGVDTMTGSMTNTMTNSMAASMTNTMSGSATMSDVTTSGSGASAVATSTDPNGGGVVTLFNTIAPSALDGVTSSAGGALNTITTAVAGSDSTSTSTDAAMHTAAPALLGAAALALFAL